VLWQLVGSPNSIIYIRSWMSSIKIQNKYVYVNMKVNIREIKNTHAAYKGTVYLYTISSRLGILDSSRSAVDTVHSASPILPSLTYSTKVTLHAPPVSRYLLQTHTLRCVCYNYLCSALCRTNRQCLWTLKKQWKLFDGQALSLCFGFKTRTCTGLWFRRMTQRIWLSLLSFVAFSEVKKSSSQ
jgi:hypothetical protein